MSNVVSLAVNNGIAEITIDLPPVNALNYQIRAGLLETFQAAIANPEVKAIVLLCAGRTYMAGADINEFNTGVGEPSYHDVYRLMENSEKLVVTGLHGTALGGGLEAALACHYRCATASARMGLPELSLGIIPGAGGSQRLPRLIGAKTTVEMVFGIGPITTDKAMELGLLDRIIEGDLRDGAITYARELLESGAGPRRCGEMEVDTKGYDDEFIASMKKLAAKRMRGQDAPDRLLEAVGYAISLPLEEGLIEEARIGNEAIASVESKSLRHIFFAERDVAKIPDIDRSTELLGVKTIGILGSGTMGTGIGMSFANAGFDVKIVDPSKEALERGLGQVKKTYTSSVARGRMNEATKQETLARISGSTDYDALKDADLVIEAVFEDMDLKKNVFRKLDEICKPGAILATNTSTLDIDEIAAVTKRPESLIGLHFFSPANIMKLLEIVRAEKTSKQVLATSVNLARKIRKTAVTVGNGDTFGFVGNRMMIMGYIREADQILLEGATVQQIDKAIYDFGFAMGPWTMNDLGGVDIMCKVLESTGAAEANPEPFFAVTRALGAQGHLGQKTGRGFYRYESDDRTPIYDPEIEKLISGEAARLNISHGSVSDEEIQTRCVYALINEAAKILDEGLVYRASDIDAIWVHGYGFPRFRGGPMFYADQIGLKAVYDTICGYKEQFGDYWTVAPLLKKYAKEGKNFSDWKSAL